MPKIICNLTHQRGNAIKCHLIPKAFTKPEEHGRPLIQSGSGRRAIRRWDSWYDRKLVIDKGEEIFEKLDDWAISFLREQKLVWSSWGSMVSLGPYHNPFADSGWGIRNIDISNPDMLRLFFLSLLWRAAATKISEFDEVVLQKKELRILGEMLVSGTIHPINFYPVTLTQLSTTGAVHNLTPFAQTKTIPAIDTEPERQLPIFRFYFDGLIAHVHRQTEDDGYTRSLGSLIVGAEEKLTVSTVSYETSFERENLEIIMAETIGWPDGFERSLKDSF